MKSVILATGGIKSAVLLALSQREGEETQAWFIRHNNDNHQKEETHLHLVAQHYGVSVFLRSLETPEGWLPFKLSFFIFYTLMWAQTDGRNMVYYGSSKDDFMIEGTEEYLVTMRQLSDFAVPRYNEDDAMLRARCDAEAPLALLDMPRIIRVGADLRVPFQLTWSCERAGVTHCGECEHCRRRYHAFKRAGVPDPTIYGEQYDTTNS